MGNGIFTPKERAYHYWSIFDSGEIRNVYIKTSLYKEGEVHTLLLAFKHFSKGMQMNFWMFVQEVVKITIAVLFYFYFTAKQADFAFSTPILIKDS